MNYWQDAQAKAAGNLAPRYSAAGNTFELRITRTTGRDTLRGYKISDYTKECHKPNLRIPKIWAVINGSDMGLAKKQGNQYHAPSRQGQRDCQKHCRATEVLGIF